MAVVIAPGPVTWSVARDGEGQREFKVKHRARGLPVDGPARVLAAMDVFLPPGTVWNFGAGEVDMWAHCLPTRSCQAAPEIKEGEKFAHWVIESVFGTKGYPRCQDIKVENPLLEPPKISGSFLKFKEAGLHDRFGRRILSSSYESIRGPNNEWDMAYPTVRIEQNVANSLQAITYPALMINCLNPSPLWGMPARCIKLSNSSYDRKYYGACYVYYTRTLEFEVNPRTFDRDLMDEGTKALHGRKVNGVWTVETYLNGDVPDYRNPLHFDRFKDEHGEVTTTLLNGFGVPITTIGEVTACTTCPSGISPTFSVVLSKYPNVMDLKLNYNTAGNPPLFPGNLCFWDGYDEYDNYYWLEYDAANSRWELGNSSTAEMWTISAASFNCGKNAAGTVTAKTLVELVDPSSLATVTGLSVSPATLHIEKYHEANFLLMGIPIVL